MRPTDRLDPRTLRDRLAARQKLAKAAAAPRARREYLATRLARHPHRELAERHGARP